MHVPPEFNAQQQIDEFNRRLQARAALQQQVCVRLAAERVQQDIYTLLRPLPASPVARLAQWIGRQLGVHAGAVRPHDAGARHHSPFPPSPGSGWLDEDAVVVVDAEYDVVASDLDQSTTAFAPAEGAKTWDS